jgi:hypothetical protein
VWLFNTRDRAKLQLFVNVHFSTIDPPCQSEMYPYKPLSASAQEIRLIHLKPGCGTDEIECSLVHASFPPTPDVFDPKAPLSLQARSLEGLEQEWDRGQQKLSAAQPLSNLIVETSREDEIKRTRRNLQLAKRTPIWEGETSRQSEESSASIKSVLTSIPIYEALSYTVSLIDFLYCSCLRFGYSSLLYHEKHS